MCFSDGAEISQNYSLRDIEGAMMSPPQESNPLPAVVESEEETLSEAIQNALQPTSQFSFSSYSSTNMQPRSNVVENQLPPNVVQSDSSVPSSNASKNAVHVHDLEFQETVDANVIDDGNIQATVSHHSQTGMSDACEILGQNPSYASVDRKEKLVQKPECGGSQHSVRYSLRLLVCFSLKSNNEFYIQFSHDS